MSTKNEAIPTTTTVLSSSANWLSWNKEFRNRMGQWKLLDYLDGKRDLLSDPGEFFNPVQAFEEWKVKRLAEIAKSLVSSSSTQTISSLDAQAAPTTQPAVPAQQQLDEAKEKLDNEIKAFRDRILESLKDQHTERRRAHRKEEDNLNKANEWLNKSVAVHYKDTHFTPGAEIRQWYRNLRNVAMQSTEIDDELRTQYRTPLTTLQQRHRAIRPTEFDQWLTTWETIFERASERGFPETTDPQIWCNDLLTAVTQVLPFFIQQYKIAKMAQYQIPGAVQFRDVTRDLRFASRMMQPSGRVARGSFPAFGLLQQGEEDTNKSNKLRRSKRKLSDTDAYRTLCRACQGFHSVDKCYYLYPDLAPPYWTEHPAGRKRVDESLSSDPDLQAEVDRHRTKRTKTDHARLVRFED
ncbi:hypothetical protein C8A03DRAFT_19840 [Achaetomium macrosporum]|uniref:Gag protein n=1 Tax=Achaetomium macrosporum TaxID=79813 RepID=A0AAN7C0Q7_9PEZI|nr:hypothetical protein C8A03DRAFT_19840 [Achaetomium macrosporum]